MLRSGGRSIVQPIINDDRGLGGGTAGRRIASSGSGDSAGFKLQASVQPELERSSLSFTERRWSCAPPSRGIAKR